MYKRHSILGVLVAALLLVASSVSATTWSLSENSPLGENFLDAAIEPAAFGVSADLLRDSSESWDRTAAECFVAPSRLPPTLTHRNGIYEALSEQPIFGASRTAHRASANRAFLNQLESDPTMARQLGEFLGTDDLIGHMRSGRGGLRNPVGTEWHHQIGDPNVLQLLRRETHRAPDLQPNLHPGPQNRGGYGTFYGD